MNLTFNTAPCRSYCRIRTNKLYTVHCTCPGACLFPEERKVRSLKPEVNHFTIYTFQNKRQLPFL